MARGRAAGITQRTARAIGGDGRTLVLEPLDRRGQRRLRQVDPPRRRGERAGGGHRHELLELAQHRPIVSSDSSMDSIDSFDETAGRRAPMLGP